jgi:DNA helicase-2/ATP-dependent DNA helicase PcrA
MLLNGGEEEADRLNNVQELISTAVEFEKQRGEEATFGAYLEDVALITDVDSLDSDGSAVTLMTIHSADF